VLSSFLRLTTLALALLVALSVRAATLAQAVDAALALERQQARAEALRREGAAVREQAASLVAQDPALRVKHLSDRFNDDAGAVEWEAMVDLPLWLPGQRDARTAVADAAEQGADRLEVLLRWEMAGRLRESAWAAALAEAGLQQAALALESARTLEGEVEKRTRAGELARMDLLLARQESLSRELEWQAARATHVEALARYRELSGLDDLPDPLVEPLTDQRELPEGHPRLLVADGRVARARSERDRVRGEQRANPVLSLGGKRQRGSYGEATQDLLSLELTLPLGLASQAAPRLAGAELELTERASERQRTLLDLRQALLQARLAQSSAQQALGTARRQQTLAAEALALRRRAFELGETGLTQLLQARQKSLAAELDLRLRALEQGQAVAQLNQALGVIPQ
jgi:cobalt-zinc-cadmium efflux system outer membrane protein